MRYRARVLVRRRDGIADPEGTTVQRALPALGFRDIADVRFGKAVWMDVDAADEAAATAMVRDLCARLLANPVIEDVDIMIEPAVS